MLKAQTPEDLAGIIEQTPRLSIADGENAGEAWVRAAVKHLQAIRRVRRMKLAELFHDARFCAEQVYESQQAGALTPPMIRRYSMSVKESKNAARLSKAPDEQGKLQARSYTSGLQKVPVDLSRYSQENGWTGRSMSVSS